MNNDSTRMISSHVGLSGSGKIWWRIPWTSFHHTTYHIRAFVWHWNTTSFKTKYEFRLVRCFIL